MTTVYTAPFCKSQTMTDTQPLAVHVVGDYSLILTIVEEWVHAEPRDTHNIYGEPTVVYDDVIHTKAEHFELCVVESTANEVAALHAMWEEMDDIPF